MNYTVKRKIEIEGDNGENLLEVTYEEGYSIWQQLNAIYNPDANPGPGAPVPSVPPVPPIITVTANDPLKMSPFVIQMPPVTGSVSGTISEEVPAG